MAAPLELARAAVGVMTDDAAPRTALRVSDGDALVVGVIVGPAIFRNRVARAHQPAPVRERCPESVCACAGAAHTG